MNLKAILILTGTLLGLGTAVHFVHGFQVKRNAYSLLEDADRAEQGGDPHQAADLLSQYVLLVPDDFDARARYALLLSRSAEKPRQVVQAYLALGAVLMRGPDRADVLRATAKLAVRMGRISEVREHLEVLRRVGQDDAELLALQARCEVLENRPGEAAKWYAKALQKVPADFELAMTYATMLRQSADAEGLRAALAGRDPAGLADQLVERAVTVAGHSAAARLAAARYFHRWGALAQAERQVAAALAAPTDPGADLLLLAATVARDRSDAPASRKRLERGLRSFPSDARFARELAALELQAGHRAQALAYLKPILDQMPTEPADLWLFGNVLVELGQTRRAEQVIDHLEKAGDAWAADCLHGALFMHQGAWGAARAALDKSLLAAVKPPQELSATIHVMLGDCHARLGNPDQEVEEYRRALASNPALAVTVRRKLAAALVALGKPEQAATELRTVAATSADARIELARLELDRNRKLPPAERQWDEMERLLEEAPPGRAAEVALLRAELANARGDTTSARKMADAQRARDPKQVRPWLVLLDLAERGGKPGAVLDVLDRAEKQTGRRVEWHLARARYWARSGAPTAVAQLDKLLADLTAFSSADQQRLLLELGAAYLRLGKGETAERLWQQLAQQRPNDLDVHFRLFGLAAQSGRDRQAQALLADLKRIEGPGGAVSAYAQAVLFANQVRRGDPTALGPARQALQQAAIRRPSWGRVALLEAELYDLEGRPADALPHYLAAIDKGERSARTVRRALQLLQEQGRYAEAQALLQRMPRRLLGTDDERLTAQFALLADSGPGHEVTAAERRKAFEQARQAVGADSKQYRDYFWLGEMALLAGERGEAEAALRKSCALADGAPGPWVALVALLAPTDLKKAEAVLDLVRSQLPQDRQPAVLAPCYESLGRAKDAEQQYLALVAARPTDMTVRRNLADFYLRFGERTKGEQLLRQLLAAGADVTEDTRRWARRGLAVILGTRGDRARRTEALALLAENERGRLATAEDVLARALVLASNPEQRSEAIRLLKASTTTVTALPMGRLLLAQLDEAEGNWAEAKAQLRLLLAGHERNPRYLAQFARALIRHQEFAAAAPLTERLTAVIGLSFEAVELRAHVLKGLGQSPEAAAMIQAFVRQKDENVVPAAGLLDDLGFTADAEALFRASVAAAKDRRAPLCLAVHLAHHGRLPEALVLCQNAWQTCPPEAVAATCISVLRTGAGNEEQAQRVEDWLNTALARKPTVVTLLILLADVKLYRKRPDEAEALYRRALVLDPGNAVARNNLAYHLAFKPGPSPEALALINGAIDTTGASPQLLDTRAVVEMKSGRPDLAAGDLRMAIAQRPTGDKYFHLAQALLLAHNRVGSRDAFRKATGLGLKPDDLSPAERPDFEQMREP